MDGLARGRAPPLPRVGGCTALGAERTRRRAGRSNFDLLTEAIAQPRLEGQPPPPLLPLLLELQCSHSQLVLSPYLLLELAGHRYELVTFPPNPDMWGLGNERTPRDRGIWKRHPVAQSGKALAPGRAGELSWRLFCPGTV